VNHSRDLIFKRANSQVIGKIQCCWMSQARSVLIVLRRNPEQLVEKSHAARLLRRRERRAAQECSKASVSIRHPRLYHMREHNPPSISNIPSWQVQRTKQLKKWNEIAERNWEANRRWPPSSDGTSSLLLQSGCLFGFAGIGMLSFSLRELWEKDL
jgi:hypothetical protein